MKRYQVILTLAAVLLLLGIVGAVDAEEESAQEARYCAMVKLWKETNGREGWPAYEGEEACR